MEGSAGVGFYRGVGIRGEGIWVRVCGVVFKVCSEMPYKAPPKPHAR